MAAEGLSPAMEVEQLYKTLPPVRPRRHRRPSRRLAAACLRRLHCRSGLPGGASPHEGGQRRTPAHALASAATVRRGGERWLERVGGCPCIGGRAAAVGERALTGRDPQDARRDVPRQTRDPLARQWHATAAVSNLLATPATFGALCRPFLAVHHAPARSVSALECPSAQPHQGVGHSQAGACEDWSSAASDVQASTAVRPTT